MLEAEFIPLEEIQLGTLADREDTAWFAKDIKEMEVSASEISSIICHYPLCIKYYENEPRLTCLFGLDDRGNLFVDANGFWSAAYSPVSIRAWPFGIRETPDRNQLGIGLAKSSVGPEESSFSESFTVLISEKEFSETTLTAIDMLKPILNTIGPTRKVVKYLEQLDLITPWKIQINDDGKLIDVGGIFQINEQRLQSLPAESLKFLALKGGLGLAYAQILSQSRIENLQERLIQGKETIRAKTALVENASGGKIEFDFL